MPHRILPALLLGTALSSCGLEGNRPELRYKLNQGIVETNVDLVADKAAQELRRDVFKARLEAAGNTMEQGIYRATMNDARAALGQEAEIPTRGGAIAFGARMEG